MKTNKIDCCWRPKLYFTSSFLQLKANRVITFLILQNTLHFTRSDTSFPKEYNSLTHSLTRIWFCEKNFVTITNAWIRKWYFITLIKVLASFCAHKNRDIEVPLYINDQYIIKQNNHIDMHIVQGVKVVENKKTYTLFARTSSGRLFYLFPMFFFSSVNKSVWILDNLLFFATEFAWVKDQHPLIFHFFLVTVNVSVFSTPREHLFPERQFIEEIRKVRKVYQITILFPYLRGFTYFYFVASLPGHFWVWSGWSIFIKGKYHMRCLRLLFPAVNSYRLVASTTERLHIIKFSVSAIEFLAFWLCDRTQVIRRYNPPL